MKKYISDVITTKDINEWKSNEVVIIKAQTGKGKSHFIKNDLYNHAKATGKRILMLIHRVNCVNQFQMEIQDAKKDDVITIITYQKLEAKIKNEWELNLEQFDIIVLDEMQYGLDDSPFNHYTDLAVDRILEENDKLRIFMSATADDMISYIKNYKKIETKDYIFDVDYNHVTSLMFYHNDETLEKIMQQCVDENKKAIFFITSAKKAYELHKKFKEHSMFVCSQSNKDKLNEYIDQNKLTKMLQNERFEDLILITTMALDSGVNIKDRDLKYIIIDAKNENSIIQCLGRKRILDENDTIEVVIKSINNKQLGGIMTQHNIRAEMATYLKKNGVAKYIHKYKREAEKFGMIYDEHVEGDYVEKKVNHMMLFKAILESASVSTMIRDYGQFAYCKYVANKLGKSDYSIIEYETQNETLEDYLNGIVGKKLFKDEQKELKEVFVKNDLKTRTLGINTMNGNLKDRKLGFMIVSKRSSKMIDGKKKDYRYWEVINNVELRTN